MPLQPSRRDSDPRRPTDFIRHHESYLRGLDPGFLGGRLATPQQNPAGPSPLTGGEEGGGGEAAESLIGEDGDRLYLADLNTQVWTLFAEPVSETLVVRWHPDADAGVEWKRGEHYTIDDGDNVVIIRAEALAAAGAEVGDVFSAQYLRVEGADITQAFTIGWRAAGWSYLALPGSPDDNTVNYSTADSSSWPVGQAPLGNVDNIAGGGALSTFVDTSLMWVKREVPATEAMTIKVRVEDNCTVYVNGIVVGTVAEHGFGSPSEATFVVSAGVLNSNDTNTIAIRVADETPVVVANISIDVQIIGTVSDA